METFSPAFPHGLSSLVMTNDACRIVKRQKESLAEPGFEHTTPGMTARVATV